MNERIVRRLWLGGSWPSGRPQTVDGTPLGVVFPGRPGHGAGPDLLDAILALPSGELLHGDVELHVKASDWRAHGHEGDARYRRVILHVVWRDDVGPASPLRTVELSSLPEAMLFDRLSAPCRAEEPYHDWVRRLSPEELTGLVEELGDERLDSRALRIAADLHALGPAEALHRALCEALGYAHNRAAFLTLAEVAPSASLRALAWAARDEEEASEIVTAHLFARAGMLDQAPIERLTDRVGAGLAGRYRSIVATPPRDRLAPGAWETIGVRPANRVARRLAALARLAVRTRVDGLDWAILDALSAATAREALGRLVEIVRVGSGEDYWSWHFDFGRRLPGAPMASLGDARVGAVLANVVLPFGLAVAETRDDAGLLESVRGVWGIAPGGGGNWITAEMRDVLTGVGLGSARREQGAIELYRRCCEERRCWTCPAGSVAARVMAPG